MASFSDWQDEVDKRADALLRIEKQTADAVGKPIEKEIAAITQGLAKRYSAQVGSIYETPDKAAVALVTSWLIYELHHIDFTHIEAEILKGAARAYQHGLRSAFSAMDEKFDARQVQLSDDVLDLIKNVRRDAEDKVRAAIKLAEQAERWGDLTTSVAKARQSASTARGAATWATNRSAADAVREVESEADGWKRVIWPENDACIHCQAYAGVSPDEDGMYPGGLTFGTKPIRTEPFESVPLHNWCRCREELIADDDDRIPEALQREAQRSIATGNTQGSEKQKLHAINVLLSLNKPLVPKTVLEKARKKQKAGGLYT